MTNNPQRFERLKGYFHSQITPELASWGTIALTVILIITIENGRVRAFLIPIPFLMLYGSVVLAALVGGVRFGIISALIVSVFIIYYGLISAGPPALTGGIIPISLGIILHVMSAILVGRVRDQTQKLLIDNEASLNKRTKALKDNETLLLSILNYSPEMIYLRDLDGRYILTNQRYQDSSKLTQDLVKGKTVYDLFTKQAADLFHANDQKIIKTRIATQFEEKIAQDNGSVKTYLTSLFPVYDASGELSAVGGITTDITERQLIEDERHQNEERYRQVLEAVSDYAYLMRVESDKSIYLEWLSGHPEDVIGYTKEEFSEDSVKAFAFRAIHAEHRDLLQQSFEELLKNQRTRVEVICQHKDGSDVWLRINRQPVWDANEQRVVRYYGAVKNITQEKKAEDTLIEQEFLKIALEKEKDLRDLRNRYLSTIAHDFRTPLTSINMANGILRRYDQKFTEEQKLVQWHRITQSVNYLDKMLEELSLIARAERGYLQFQPTLLRPASICAQIVDDFITINEDTYEIVFECVDTIEECCLDEDMLHHILLNLLSNAIKYSSKGSKVILRLSKQNSNLLIEVIDEGIGIPLEDQAQLFEPFHRAQNVGSIKGSGIGLSIVKEFVSVHGGETHFTSTVGVGTTFTLTIPIRDKICEK